MKMRCLHPTIVRRENGAGDPLGWHCDRCGIGFGPLAGAAPRAEGLPVERLARAIKSRYGLKESESEVSIFLNAIFGSGEAGHD